MAKESTAIANLLELMAQRPIDRLSGDDMLFSTPSVDAKPVKRARTRPPKQVKPVMPVDETHAVTHRIPRQRDLSHLRKPLLAATVVVSGLALGTAIYKVARGGAAVPTASAATALPLASPPPPPKIVIQPLATPPAPKAEPAPAPPPPAPSRPALVDVSIESKPAGATVTLVDRGNSSLAGTTPLALSVDPTREYDLRFALDGQGKTVHVDPRTTKKLTVELAIVEPDPVPAPAPAPAPVHRAARRAAPAAGTGTLMVSTKPPCDIAIDGKPTGLTSPQKAITVGAGHHNVTFTNSAQHLKKTVEVEVAANHPTKVIRDFMK